MQKYLIDFDAPLMKVVDDVLSPDECKRWIERIEDAPRIPATITQGGAARVERSVRSNTRIITDDEERALALWPRIKAHVAKQMHEREACGLNERFRAYRYGPGQEFAPHYDASFKRNENERSLLSVLLYLNGDFYGGATELIDLDNKRIKGAPGRMLAFQHPILHAGLPVEGGVKYVLRTDVMYRVVNGQ